MRKWILCCILSWIPLFGIADAAEPRTDQYQLANGLTVLLRPIEGAQHVALVTLYAVGGDHDPNGQSGLAHLVEHLYVTAAAGKTEARTTVEYMKRYPAGWNAQTGDRYTVIATVFAPEALEVELEDAAARMGGLRITGADLDREKPRVYSELANMFGGIPSLAARNLAREMVRPSPEGARKGGVPEQVKRLTLDQVQDRWRRYYKPKNAMLVLAGRFNVAAVRKQVAEAFADLPSGDPAPQPRPRSESRLGKVEQVAVTSRQPNAAAEACLAYAVPTPADELYAPFLVLVAKLQMGASKLQAGRGRFPVMYAPLDDPDVLYISAPLKKGEDGPDAVARLERFVASTIKTGLRPTDVTMANNVFGFMLGTRHLPDAVLAQNVYGVAFSVGRQAQLGIDPAELAKRIEATDANGLVRVAEAYFKPAPRQGGVVVTVK